MRERISRNLALFPISVVIKLTELTARQIRYYEDQGLIKPARNKGHQRIFSLNDIERLLDIKELVDQGVNIAGVKAVLQTKQQEENIIPPSEGLPPKGSLSDQELYHLLQRKS